MNEVVLIPVMILTFSALVAFAIYLERVVEKRKRSYFKKKRLEERLSCRVNSAEFSEKGDMDFSSPIPYQEKHKKLTALEQINI